MKTKKTNHVALHDYGSLPKEQSAILSPHLQKISHESEIKFKLDQVRLSQLMVGTEAVPHMETTDFPLFDPWSVHMRDVILYLKETGKFDGKQITEFGIGDGRNIKIMGPGIRGVVGVDVEFWRAQVAHFNLSPLQYERGVELWGGDAIEFIRGIRKIGQVLSGWIVMCLPQSTDGSTQSHRYDPSPYLEPYREVWDPVGLTLNAGVLDNLRFVTSSGAKALVCLSDRVPEIYKRRLFKSTGWAVERTYSSKELIQQDPDTGVSWVSDIDDGERFFEKVQNEMRPISADEAERRRKISSETGKNRDDLNVYHGLTVYQLNRM